MPGTGLPIVRLPCRRDVAGPGNIGFLPRFVTSVSQQNQAISAAGEIDAVAGAIIVGQFADPSADRFCVAEMAERQAVIALEEPRVGVLLPKRAQPAAEFGSLEDDQRGAPSPVLALRQSFH